MLQKELTYKSKDTEELLDRLITRPVGYVIALFSARVGLTPNMVTAFSIISGLIASHLFLYTSLTVNLYGIFLLILSDILDSSDGQLARLTGKTSKIGRIFDGVAGNIVAISIYIHLCLRMLDNGSGSIVIILTIISAMFHSIQACIADYYRNIYLYYAFGNSKSELESSINILSEYKSVSFKTDYIKKILLGFYYSYTKQQESLSKSFQLFNLIVHCKYKEIPGFIRTAYKMNFRPMIKYYNLLTINSRFIIIFISVLLNMPILYLLFEIIFLNIILIYVLIVHKTKFSFMSGKLIKIALS
ncbi:MAG: CDP-alcohol phosphatidyltransferase family protein [Ignavibacteria bacterium]|jgi:phosphatidylglycerophosphate synthase